MTDWFAALFASGHAVDIVLGVLAVEAVWLVWRGRGEALSALLPGALILLALRAALIGAPWWAVAGWLALSLPAHLYDLRCRLNPSGSSARR